MSRFGRMRSVGPRSNRRRRVLQIECEAEMSPWASRTVDVHCRHYANLIGGLRVMHNVVKRIAMLSVGAGALMVSACASVDDVKHAQATADQALSTAQQAQSTATAAQQAAQAAQQ